MIEGIGRLAQLIQQRISAGKASAGQPSAVARRTTQAPAQPEPATFTHLLTRVQQLAPDDPERERKAFRYFLEASLLTELGTDILADPGFEQLVDTVQQRMEAQPELLAATRRAAALLLKLGPPASPP